MPSKVTLAIIAAVACGTASTMALPVINVNPYSLAERGYDSLGVRSYGDDYIRYVARADEATTDALPSPTTEMSGLTEPTGPPGEFESTAGAVTPPAAKPQYRHRRHRHCRHCHCGESKKSALATGTALNGTTPVVDAASLAANTTNANVPSLKDTTSTGSQKPNLPVAEPDPNAAAPALVTRDFFSDFAGWWHNLWHPNSRHHHHDADGQKDKDSKNKVDVKTDNNGNDKEETPGSPTSTTPAKDASETGDPVTSREDLFELRLRRITEDSTVQHRLSRHQLKDDYPDQA